MYSLTKTKNHTLSIGEMLTPFPLLHLAILMFCNLSLLQATPPVWTVDRVICNDSLHYTQGLEIVNTPLKILPFEEVRVLEIFFDTSSQISPIQYKLDCIDKDWIMSENKKIRYTNLPKGLHQLYVKNENFSDTLSIEVFHSATLLMAKPVQEQWWFSPLLTFCLLLFPFMFIYFDSLDRSRRKIKVEEVRNQIASDLHDDIGVNLSAIKNFTEILKLRAGSNIKEKQLTLIERIESYSDETLNKLQDTVWAINPLNDSVEELIDKMKNLSISILASKNIQLQFQNNYQESAQLQFDMQQRHNLFMVFKESIHNIVKHSKASQATVHISNEQKTLAIQVTDNGIGFDLESLGSNGNGLRNFQQRAEANFMKVAIQSAEGAGTTIDIRIYSIS